MSERNESQSHIEPSNTPVSPEGLHSTLEQSIKDSRQSGSGNPVANKLAADLARGGSPDPDYADKIEQYMRGEDRS